MNKIISNASSQILRVGIVGAGYIAPFHAQAIASLRGVELAGVCDLNLRTAQSFAAQWNISAAFDSLEVMLETQKLDAVHILVPPNNHHSLAKTALLSGVNVFLEKPMCPSVEECDELLTIARDKRLMVGVNHNFLFSHAYQRLRNAISSGLLGPIDNVSLNYFFELPQIRSGPFDSWMLRAPANPLLEIGPHLISAVIDLIGIPGDSSAFADRKIKLTGGNEVYRRWRLHLTSGRTAADININLGPGFSQRTIYVRGLLGSAAVDLDANTCVLDQSTPFGPDLDRYRRSRSLAQQIRSQAWTTLADYILTKLKLRHRGNPYQVSIVEAVAAFYGGLRTDNALDHRIDGKFGRNVIEWCTKIILAANVRPLAPAFRPRKALLTQPTVLVLGGSGFIGRELIRKLLASGYCVRAMIRNSSAALEELDSDRLEIVRGDSRNISDLTSAMRDIEFVYHLATSEAKTWDESIRNNVEPTRLVGQVCLSAGVKRLVYTGTIDSYYAGAKAGTITEQTPLDRNIRRRNYYARAKASAEAILMSMHHTQGLPVVIFRPGIVIGQGGNPFHWGVGRFSGSVCEVWGEGKNKLPFVLVSDVASSLLRGIEVSGIEGRSYNLVDTPLLNAREYLEEMQRLAGMSLTVHYRSIFHFYLADIAKWVVKVAVGHPDRARIPSYLDWESRTQNALFDCARARSELGWAPVSDRLRMIEQGIGGSLKSWLEATK